MTACASCYARLRTANHKVRNDPNERDRAERITGKPYDGSVEVHHVLDVLVNHLGLDAIRAKVRRPLAGLRVACYYGCLLTRPPEIVAFDDAEHPTCMDELVAAAGGAGRLAVQDGMLRGQPVDDALRRREPSGPPAAVAWPARRAPSASPSPARCARSTSTCVRPTRRRPTAICPTRRSSTSRSFSGWPWGCRRGRTGA